VPNLSPDIGDGSEIPLSVRLHLGAKLALGDRLIAGDALLWLLSLPQFHLRTAAVRCFDEFLRLWSVLFNGEFSGGYRVAIPQSRLAIRYRAASGAFEVEIPGPHSRYPDIAVATQPFDDLRALADACTEKLDAFSRFVGKCPDQRASVQAALLLPEPLRKGAVEAETRGLVKRIHELLDGKRTAITDLRDLLAVASIDAPASAPALSGAVEQLGKVLDLFDIAIEPDRRYGSGVAQLDDPVVIFTADRGAPIDASKSAYAAMKVRVEVSALAAVSDGNATPDELQSIITTIRADHSLTQIERLRLIAYAVTIFKSPPKQQRILRRLSDTREEERKAIAAAAARVVSAQENADPKSIRFLEKLHRTLKLPVDQVYSDLHRITVDAPVPVTVEQRVPGVRIPKEVLASRSGDGIRIDNRKLADVQRDTAAVAQILSGIFIDDPHPAEAGRSEGSAAPSPSGLDAEHIQLVIYLKNNGEVGRSDFEEAARALKLLPDGAIERINDWSFDRFDEPLLEDGECIVLIPHLREKIAELNM
jgi:tellurite resistance protein